MSTNKLIIIYIICIFLFIQHECLYIQKGMNTINNFLYLSRIFRFYQQTYKESCSLTEASNCYFTEKKYIQNILSSKEDLLINQDWIKLHSKIEEDFDYEEILFQLTNKTSNYIDKYMNETDEEQHPISKELNIIMTFDDETTRPDMYIHELSAIFYNEKITAEINGELKLSNKYKEISQKSLKNYPSNLYGVIESDLVSISFQGKLFLFVSIYIRAHKDENKYDNINFYGYLGNNIVYAYSYTDQSRKEKNWLKVLSHTNVYADKLIISGPYDIDNIEFKFEYETNVEIGEMINMNIEQKTFKLIDDDEI